MRIFENFGECYSTSASQEENGCSITTANPSGVGEGLDTALQIQNKSQLWSLELNDILTVAHYDGRGLRSTGSGLPRFFQSIQSMILTLQADDDNNKTFYESSS